MSRRECLCSEWVRDGMCGILPTYDDSGANISLILFDDRDPIYEPRRVNTVIRELAGLFYKDVDLIRKEAREIAGQRTGNALPIASNMVLVPFKIRQPIGRDDGAMGYIFKSSISNVKQTTTGTCLHLKSGQTISILDSAKTAKHRIAMATYIKNQMLNDENDPTSIANLRILKEIYFLLLKLMK